MGVGNYERKPSGHLAKKNLLIYTKYSNLVYYVNNSILITVNDVAIYYSYKGLNVKYVTFLSSHCSDINPQKNLVPIGHFKEPKTSLYE